MHAASWQPVTAEADLFILVSHSFSSLIKTTKWPTKGEGRGEGTETDRGRQWHLACSSTWEATMQQHTRSHANYPSHNSGIRSACHQPASNKQQCNVPIMLWDRERKTDRICTYSVTLAYGRLLIQASKRFHMSFHPPFSSLLDTNLLIMPFIPHHSSPFSHSLSQFIQPSITIPLFFPTYFQPFRSKRA